MKDGERSVEAGEAIGGDGEPEFGSAASAAIQAEAQRRQPLDRSLAADLGGEAGAVAPEPVTAGYLRQLDRRSRLSELEERKLIADARAGDRAATARLVEEFLPAIGSVAGLYRYSARVDRVEFVQEGVVGLLRALESYDPDRGVRFWTYATWWVRQAMQHLVSELTLPVVLSDRALRQLSRVRDAHASYLRDHGREPSRRELADAARLSADQVAGLIATGQPARPLDSDVEVGERTVGPFGDLLVDPLAEGEYERVLDNVEVDQLRSLLGGLSDRERMVLRLRYGLDGEEESLRRIGRRLGLSAERVRQIEQRALGKLRSMLDIA
jgi:RNA polymerase sigma factor (sigma-70 family)